MTTWTKNLANKHTYLLSKSMNANELYTLTVSGGVLSTYGEVYLGAELFIGYLEGGKLTFSLEQASDVKFITIYILSSNVKIYGVKLENGDIATNYKPAKSELLLPLNKEHYMSPSMTYQINGNIISFDGENVDYVLDGHVVNKKGINLIRNGGFARGVSGWIPYYATGNVRDCTYTLKALGTFSRPYVRYTTDIKCGDIVYIKFNARINNNLATNIYFDVLGTESGTINGLNRIEPPEDNTWYEVDDVVNTNAISGNLILEIYHSYIDSNTAKDKEMEINNVQLTNLTQSYGLGNEPSLDYIHSHPEEFAWTPNPKELVETVEVKNNLVGDLENPQGSRLLINSLKIYSRNLTDSEMIQNYKVEKKRFGM